MLEVVTPTRYCRWILSDEGRGLHDHMSSFEVVSSRRWYEGWGKESVLNVCPLQFSSKGWRRNWEGYGHGNFAVTCLTPRH